MRHQHALIAQAKFAAESSGQFDQDLVPRLCGYLHSLPKYKFGDGLGLKGNSSSLKVVQSGGLLDTVNRSFVLTHLFLKYTLFVGKSPADNITASFITHLLTIANKRPSTRQDILDSVWAYFDKLSTIVLSDNGM